MSPAAGSILRLPVPAQKQSQKCFQILGECPTEHGKRARETGRRREKPCRSTGSVRGRQGEEMTRQEHARGGRETEEREKRGA